jgi:ribosomal protein S18 acetylase RimI-like enzyme
MHAGDDVTDLRFRRPTEADHPALVGVVDEWWGGRRMQPFFQRLWFQHFCGTSWLAELPDGRPAGFLVGFISPDDPTVGYVKLITTNPNLRQRGLGRELYERFIADVAARGVREVRAITWPGNRVSVRFHTAIGFRPVDGAGTQNLYGTPAFPDYDAPGEDRVVFVRRVE